MSEGFFHPSQIPVPELSVSRLMGALVRIQPKTKLILDIADSGEAAASMARNEVMEDGTECWFRYFTREDLARVEEPEFAMGMVRHEFSRLVRSGASFPADCWLDGGGSGFCIDPHGLVLTNYHLVTGEVALHGREAGVISTEVLCKGLRAEVAIESASGEWSWQPATRIWLVANPPRERALWDDGQGRLHLREDTALLRIEPAPLSSLDLSRRQVVLGESLWMAGFPLRSARSPAALDAAGYADADGTIRVSTGSVTGIEGTSYFSSDLDGSMGNSGSPVFDRTGCVVGMFSRAVGNGPKNAFEYGHMERVHVTTGLAAAGLGIELPAV